MKVLIIGSGGREHAMAWQIAKSPLLTKLFIAPGNPGTESLGENVPIVVTQSDELLEFALQNKIDLTIVGPELPLTLGIVDLFESKGLAIFGPKKDAARIEGSKSYAKDVMNSASIPTALHEAFDNGEALKVALPSQTLPYVIKLDGLAAGKGVFVCKTQEESDEALKQVLENYAESEVVLEDFLEGVEVSYIVATDGERIVPMASSHDYKRIGENDAGPNTGGMGCVSPTPRLTADQELSVLKSVMEPAIKALSKEKSPYRGFLYAGLMISPTGDIKVLEFNARLGDPETQSIMRRLDSDFLELLYALTTDSEIPIVSWKPQVCVGVVLASRGYPETSTSDNTISGVVEAEGTSAHVVFHAGTKTHNGELKTAGGRVLCVTALADTVEDARILCYQAADCITFDGMQLRRDIAL